MTNTRASELQSYRATRASELRIQEVQKFRTLLTQYIYI